MAFSSSSLFLLLVGIAVLQRRCDAFSNPRGNDRCLTPPAKERMTTPTTCFKPTSAESIRSINKIALSASDNSNNGGGMHFERPDPEILLSAKDDTTQKLAIAAIVAGITAGTAVSVNILNGLETILPTSIYEPFYTVLPIVIGTAIGAAGIAHFAIEDSFTAWVPPIGTWGGLWQVPAPGAKQLGLTYEQYHNRWTGIAEIGGALLLILGRFGIIVLSTNVNPTILDGLHVPAFLLFLLVAAVTPANTYMFTHDPDIPRIPPLPYPWGHAARAAIQCLLLAVCWKWATTGI